MSRLFNYLPPSSTLLTTPNTYNTIKIKELLLSFSFIIIIIIISLSRSFTLFIITYPHHTYRIHIIDIYFKVILCIINTFNSLYVYIYIFMYHYAWMYILQNHIIKYNYDQFHHYSSLYLSLLLHYLSLSTYILREIERVSDR